MLRTHYNEHRVMYTMEELENTCTFIIEIFNEVANGYYYEVVKGLDRANEIANKYENNGFTVTDWTEINNFEKWSVEELRKVVLEYVYNVEFEPEKLIIYKHEEIVKLER